MKKTLITLFALSSLPMAAYEIGTQFTLDSKVSDTSAFAAMVGHTSAEAITSTGLGVDRLTYNDCKADIKVNKLLSDINLSELTDGQFLLVKQVQFVFRYDKQNTYLPTESALTTTIDGVTYSAGSAVMDYETGKCGTITFTMDTPFALTGSEENVQVHMTSTGSPLGFTVAKNTADATIDGVATFDGTWMPVVRLSGIVAPEPATATLSLLALAGLAARRRRH